MKAPLPAWSGRAGAAAFGRRRSACTRPGAAGRPFTAANAAAPCFGLIPKEERGLSLSAVRIAFKYGAAFLIPALCVLCA